MAASGWRHPVALNGLVTGLILGSAGLVWVAPRSILAFMAFQASLLVEGGRAADAVPIYRKLLARNPGLPTAAWGLARALVLAGEAGEADAEISVLESRFPRAAQGPVLRGLLFERRGDVEAAARAYENALALDPGNAAARRGLDRVAGARAPR